MADKPTQPLIDPQTYAAARPALMKLADQEAAWQQTREVIADFVATSRSFEQLLNGLNLFLLGLSLAK